MKLISLRVSLVFHPNLHGCSSEDQGHGAMFVTWFDFIWRQCWLMIRLLNSSNGSCVVVNDVDDRQPPVMSWNLLLPSLLLPCPASDYVLDYNLLNRDKVRRYSNLVIIFSALSALRTASVVFGLNLDNVLDDWPYFQLIKWGTCFDPCRCLVALLSVSSCLHWLSLSLLVLILLLLLLSLLLLKDNENLLE